MDAIVFFYKKRNIEEPELSMMYRGDYLLVKAGLDADRRRWFGAPLPEPSAGLPEESCARPGDAGKGRVPTEGTEESCILPQGGERAGNSGKRGKLFELFHGGRAQRNERRREREPERRRERGPERGREREPERGWEREPERGRERGPERGRERGPERRRGREPERRREREHRRQRDAEERYRQQLAQFEEAVEQTARRLKQAMGEVDGSLDVQSVYEPELTFLTEEGGIADVWNRCWGIPEFRDYRALRWAAPLAAEAAGPHFVLLGAAEAVPELLRQCARRMKSLRWILPAEDCDGEALELAEEFGDEYGLAVSPEPWTGGRVCLRPSGDGQPVCVLDFMGEGTTYGGVLPEGSVWIDFCSAEEKERRSCRMKPSVRYVSLKKYWRECRRCSGKRVLIPDWDNAGIVPRFHKCSSFLDSGLKSGYNTFDKGEK